MIANVYMCLPPLNKQIIRHAESWNVSALEAVGQIFTPGSGNRGET